jgi:hypothetical protein
LEQSSFCIAVLKQLDTDREQLVWERNEALAACADYRQSENLMMPPFAFTMKLAT